MPLASNSGSPISRRGPHHLHSGGGGVGVHRQHRYERGAMDINGEEVGVGDSAQHGDGAHLFVIVLEEAVVSREHLPSQLQRVEHHGEGHLGTDRVEAILEGGHHPEVAAAATERPQQVRVLRLAGAQHAAVGGDHVGANQVVGGEAVLAAQPAETAAQRQPGDAGGRHHPRGSGEPEGLGGAVEVAERGAPLGAGDAPLGIDLDPLHFGQVDDDAAVGEGQAGDVVAAASDRHRQAPFTGVVDGLDDVVGSSGPGRSVPGACRSCRSKRRAPGHRRRRRAPTAAPGSLGWQKSLQWSCLVPLSLDPRASAAPSWSLQAG